MCSAAWRLSDSEPHARWRRPFYERAELRLDLSGARRHARAPKPQGSGLPELRYRAEAERALTNG